jgi:hypothetical protein
MSYRLPAPLRGQYSTDGQFRNPASTVPLPAPKDMPAAGWFSNKTTLGWIVAGGTPNATATWGSPIFDLHPELRGLAPSGTSNGRSPVGAIPIWGANKGQGKFLHVQIIGLNANALSRASISLYSNEYGHVSDRGALVSTGAVPGIGTADTQLTDQADITNHITTNTNTAILNFRPWGVVGSYIRYWKINLVFQQAAAQAGAFVPNYQITAAFY